MKEKLNILILEDNPSDVELMKREIEQAGIPVLDYKIVDNKDDFQNALRQFSADLVLSDYNLPQYDAISALNFVKEHDPDLPFIVVTGTLDEETAVDTIKAGAWDYVLKERLIRLGPAIKNSMKLKGEIERTKETKKELDKIYTAVMQSPSPVIITDHEGRIEYVNPKFEEVMGRSKKEIIGNLPFIFNHSETPDKIYSEMWDTITSGKQWSGVLRSKRGDGSWIWERTSISPIKNERGEIVNFVGLMEDITKEKEADDQIAYLKKFNETIINSMDQGLLVEDENGNIVFVNPALADLTGYSKNELLNSKWDILVDEENKKKVTEIANRRSFDRSDFYEVNILSKDKKNVPVYVTATPIQVEDILNGVVVVFTDIRILKEKEDQLKKAKEKAEESDNLKSEFLANMSHEIRTPMNGIMGFTNLLLQEGVDDDAWKHYVDIIHKSSNQLLRIINDIVDFSKIQAGQYEIEENEVVLGHLLENLKDIFETQIEQERKESLKLKLSVDNVLNSKQVFIDEGKLRQILSNLLENSVKFTAEGEITIGSYLQGGNIKFFVRDTGIGISEEYHDIIFEKFRQIDSSPTRKYGGTGLGLTITKKLVELLNGNIWVDSKPGKGSTFYFTIPFKENEVSEKTKDMDISNIDWTNKEILIVEDDYTSYLYFESMLEPTNAQLFHAPSAEEGWEYYIKRDIDLILMDIRLGGASGLELTEKIREHNPTIPIIAQTAYAMSDDRKKCMDAGCNDYIAKPIDMDNLLVKLKNFLS
jgi:PAS domain S-box-containing protein